MLRLREKVEADGPDFNGDANISLSPSPSGSKMESNKSINFVLYLQEHIQSPGRK